MQNFLDIILALIDKIPWFVMMYTVRAVCISKPKKTSIKFEDKFSVESER